MVTPSKKTPNEETPNRMTFGKKHSPGEEEDELRNVDTHRPMISKEQ